MPNLPCCRSHMCLQLLCADAYVLRSRLFPFASFGILATRGEAVGEHTFITVNSAS